MDKYEFKLAPAYCLFNGTAVKEQDCAEICFWVENINDLILQGRLRRAFQRHIEYVLSMEDCPDAYRNLPKVSFEACQHELVRNYVSKRFNEERAPEQLEEKSGANKSDAAAVIMLDTILCEARDKGASDVHIEKGDVRLRINGSLEAFMYLQEDKASELIQRIKLLAGMNLLEKRRSQDGHFSYGNNKPIFVRVSSMPVYNEKLMYEESIVLRLLDTSRLPLDLNLLGFLDSQVEIIEGFEAMKNGLLLICGPTGAGKSTTAAAILTDIQKKSFGKKKIISMEDPPEYVIPYVSQIQIDSAMDNSFQDCLVHIFRQDPDVIMIGEIRDELSAQTALRAAMTGHLVIATLHTSSPMEAFLRMENLGADKRILSSILKGVICQELEYLGEETILFADVSLVDEDFSNCVEKELPMEELDRHFSHNNNYCKGLNTSIEIMGMNYKKKKPLYRVWNGGRDDKKNNRRLG
ncbi:MAG: Flp pilus assembly complex ATPase component TadA [Treponema sp.]|nr:Flp pilus assembly complex ATPase component TadA [Treponema sp.]